MKLASKGLGKLALPLRFTEARLSEAAECLVLEGVIKEQKVNWTYRAELEDSDILNFVILARNPVIVSYIADRLGVALFVRLIRSALALVPYVFMRDGARADVAGSRNARAHASDESSPGEPVAKAGGS